MRAKGYKGIAQKTKLGYVIFENQKDPYTNVHPYIGSITVAPTIRELNDTIQKLWHMEELPQKKVWSEEEGTCEDIFRNTHSREPGGRYIVRIPFNDKLKDLGKSKKMALHQFFAMEGRMKRNKEFADKYKMFMSEYETLGHMTQIRDLTEDGYYTPHHGVLSSDKFRVVFNASAKTTTGITLNETQLVGEKLQRDLFLILMNFRRYKFGLTADIEKMYRQVLVHGDDRKYQKILWRPSETEPIRTYQLNTVTYGHACAPHCAIRTLVQIARDYASRFPRASKLAQECFYVDDLLAGANSMEDVQKIKNEMEFLLNQGRMMLTKWKTNGQFCEKIEIGEKNEEDGPRVLGLCWDLKTDKLFYKIRGEKRDEKIVWTKRRILSKIGKLYDPNGFLGPIIMQGKLLIRTLWLSISDWDDPITGKVKREWELFNEDLINIQKITINRWFGIKPKQTIQLHGFCDASTKGYGAVIYVRGWDGTKHRIEIIAAKSRVAPIKPITIPRLKLSAANLLADLFDTVAPIFRKNLMEFTAWTDSEIVLAWIKTPASTMKVYVANRIANIQAKLNSSTWRWIAGKENPADLLSRGVKATDLIQADHWWQGPGWLKLPSNNWPEQTDQTKEPPEVNDELKAVHAVVIRERKGLTKGKCDKFRQKTFPLLQAYGEWEKLLRVTAYIFRAWNNFKPARRRTGPHPEKRATGPLTKGELEIANNYLIRIDQGNSFPTEIEAGKKNIIEVLAKLSIIYDKEQKKLRLDGRIKSKNLTRNEQFPILKIIDKGCTL